MLLTKPTLKRNNCSALVKPICIGVAGVFLVSNSLTLFAQQSKLPANNNSAPQKVELEQNQTNRLASLTNQLPQAVRPIYQARIQMAILLDTSGSMDGLIDQTRNQLWSVVNELASAKKNGVMPILEVALFEYGNDSNPAGEGYVRQLNAFTRELDRVSEGLFSLKTNGGSEFCGVAIQKAVNNLQWSRSANDVKLIFIAGNEAFSQGPVNYRNAIKLAAAQGISVNTIFAGDYQQGIQTGWKSGAILAGGNYMSIDADRRIVHVEAPQDQQIAALNSQLNQTYIPYGKEGKKSAQRQHQQDQQSQAISSGLLAKRVQSKSSALYNNSDWDLVDAVNEGKIEASELAELTEEQLPEPMKAMSPEQRQQYVEQQAESRNKIQQQISQLSKSRSVFVAEKSKQLGASAASMSDAFSAAVRNQASKKSFEFDSESENKNKTGSNSKTESGQ